MSSDPPDTNAYAFAYETAVYDNLFVGIVYGRQPLLFPFLLLQGHVLSVYLSLGAYQGRLVKHTYCTYV